MARIAPGAAKRRADPACFALQGPNLVVLTVESYTHPDAHGLRVPVLRRLVADCASSDGARSVFPSVTYPAHTSIASGVLPGRHGIVANRFLDKNQEGWRWYAEDVKVPRVWDLASNAGYSSAVINWPVTVGANATYLVPEIWRAGTSDDQKLVRALSTPGLLDAVGRAYPDFPARATDEGIDDEGKTDIASYLLEKDRPIVLFLHLTQVDSAQHKHGLWSAEALTAIEATDRQLGRLLEATQRAGIAPSTDIVVASDHGFADVNRLVRPGALLRQAGLIRLDEKQSGQLGRLRYGDYDAPVTVKAMHGYDPERPDMRASLLLFGPNIPKGKLLDAQIVESRRARGSCCCSPQSSDAWATVLACAWAIAVCGRARCRLSLRQYPAPQLSLANLRAQLRLEAKKIDARASGVQTASPHERLFPKPCCTVSLELVAFRLSGVHSLTNTGEAPREAPLGCGLGASACCRQHHDPNGTALYLRRF